MPTGNETNNELTVSTNLGDYAPGETAIITADGLEAGATVEFQVQHVDGAGADGIYGTADDLLDSGLDGVYGTADDGTGPNPGAYASDHDSFTVTDGVSWWDAGADGTLGTADDILMGDLDGVENGSIVTSWYVRDPDSVDETFLLSAKAVDPSTGGYTGSEAYNTFTDSGGAYRIDFSAGDPTVYNTTIPYPGDVTPISGRGDGDNEIAGTDSAYDVESLAPEDMALGQVVPFLFEITVDGDTAPENGTITFTAGWSTVTTSGGNFGYDDFYGVIAAFVDTSDAAHDDVGGNATVTGFSWVVVGDEIQGTFTVSGLEDGDTVVVEAWLVLDDEIAPSGITGNVQSRLIDAETVTDDPDSINTGNQTVPLLRPANFYNAEADLEITKTDLSDPVQVGDDLTYEITVTNNGPAVANQVVVVDALDPNVTYVSDDNGGTYSNGGTAGDPSDDTVTWDLGALAVGESRTFTVTVNVNLDAPTGGLEDLNNTVTVTTISDDPNLDNNTATEPTDVIEPANPILSIDKVVTGVDTAGDGILNAVGDIVDYAIHVTNDGNVELTNVTITDPLTGVSEIISTLAPDATVSVYVSYAITQEDLDSNATLEPDDLFAGSLDNTATADSDQTGPATDSESVDIVRNAALEVAKSADVTTVSAEGDEIVYTYSVYNLGNVSLTGVALVDDAFTPGVTGDDVSPTLTGGDTDNDGELDVDEVWTYSYTHVVTQAEINAGDDLVNVVTATSNETDPETDDETVEIDYYSDMLLIKEADVDTVDAAGDQIVYTYTLTNRGNVSLTNVTLTDDAFTPGDLGDDFNPDLVSGDLDNDSVLDVGEIWTYSYTHTVTQAEIDAGGELTNTAVAATDQAGPEISSVNVAVVQNPVLEVVKEADVAAVAAAGDQIVYTYTLTNGGNVSLTDVTLWDDAFTPGDGADDFEPTFTGGDTDNDNELDVGEVWTYIYTHVVTGDEVAAGDDLVNVATADSEETEAVTDDATVVIADPEISIVKQIKANGQWYDADGAPEELKLLATEGKYEYRIVVTNTGNVELTGVKVWDPNLGIGKSDAYVIGSLGVDGRKILTAEQISELEFCWSKGNEYNTAYADSDQTGPVSDDANYFGAIAGLKVDKVTIDEHGTKGDNLVVAAGSDIQWQYSVTNTGNVDITTFSIFDDNGTWDESDDWDVTNLVSGDDNHDGILNVGETWVYVEDGTAIDGGKCDDKGRYSNYVIVNADYTDDAGLTRGITVLDTSSYTIEGYKPDPDDGGSKDEGGQHHDDDGWHHGDSADDHYVGCGIDDRYRGRGGDDEMHGKSGHDTFHGDRGKDHIHGDRGNDEAHGGNGNDNLYGGKGKDWLYGDKGKDHIEGGKGHDKMWGGDDCDTFVFRDGDGKDKILDFNAEGRNHDVIDLCDVSDIGGWKDLRTNHLEEVNKGVWIHADDVDIFLKGVDCTDLDRDDFSL